MDFIYCEACGARLLFSTPSAWTLQQVEKAAAVFSLKLNSGHKMLCPWIDNACDEALALFPPTPPMALVEGYNERSSTLLRLIALPVISSSTVDYINSPQLEHFLSQFCPPAITLNTGIKFTDESISKDLERESETVTASTYYQALKIISLFGWEPRLLPYTVDHKDQSSPLETSASLSESSSHILDQEKDSIILYSSSGRNELEGGKSRHLLGEYQYDPACIVLDCRFCGACVGLWAFATIERPLEPFRLVAECSGQNEPATCDSGLPCVVENQRTKKFGDRTQYSKKGVSCDVSTTNEKSLGLNLTIAGGPLPAKQNFRPRVSFPIISRHLRAEFGYVRGVGNYVTSKNSCRSEMNTHCFLQNGHPLQHQKDIDHRIAVQSEGLGLLKRKRSEDGEKFSDCIGNESRTSCTSSKARSCNTLGIHSLQGDTGEVESLKEVMQSRLDDLHRGDDNPKNSEKEAINAETDAKENYEVGERQLTTSNANETIGVSRPCESKSGSGLAGASHPHEGNFSILDSLQHHSVTIEDNHSDSFHNTDTNATRSIVCYTESDNGCKGSGFQKIKDAQAKNPRANGFKDITLSSVNREENTDHAPGSSLKSVQTCKIREFDPIKQHRTFCPWIASEDSRSLPGWKLTLSALSSQQEKDSSHDPPSALLEEADDPIVSVRKLFMSPPTKRLKSTN